MIQFINLIPPRVSELFMHTCIQRQTLSLCLVLKLNYHISLLSPESHPSSASFAFCGWKQLLCSPTRQREREIGGVIYCERERRLELPISSAKFIVEREERETLATSTNMELFPVQHPVRRRRRSVTSRPDASFCIVL